MLSQSFTLSRPEQEKEEELPDKSNGSRQGRAKRKPKEKLITFLRNEIIFNNRKSLMLNLRDVTAQEDSNKMMKSSAVVVPFNSTL